jgi:endonuclease YncB( thermonuclease family)
MRYVLLLLLAFSTARAHAETIIGQVTKVSDGDTITVDRTRVVRLANIDAPR